VVDHDNAVCRLGFIASRPSCCIENDCEFCVESTPYKNLYVTEIFYCEVLLTRYISRPKMGEAENLLFCEAMMRSRFGSLFNYRIELEFILRFRNFRFKEFNGVISSS
jgi:hypothetical protein